MNQRENLLAAFFGKEPKGSLVALWTNPYASGQVERDLRALGMGLVLWRPVTTTLGPATFLSEIDASEVQNVKIEIEHRYLDDKRVDILTYSTPIGTLTREVEIEKATGAYRLKKHYISSIEDYKIATYIVENTRFTPNQGIDQNTTQDDLEGAGVYVSAIDPSPFQKCIASFVDPKRLLEDYATHPNEVDVLLKAISKKLEEQLAFAAKDELDFFLQMENLNGDLITSEIFEKYHLPYYKKCAEILRKSGKPYIIFLMGKFRLFAKQIAESGVTGVIFNPFEDFGSDVSFKDARELMPNLTLIPLCPAAMARKSTEEISAYAKLLKKDADGQNIVLLYTDGNWKNQRHILTVFAKEL